MPLYNDELIHKIKVCVGDEELFMSYREKKALTINSKKTLICGHGITHNSRVFDYLSSQMAEHYRVISPDFVGRGLSDRLKNKLQYNYYTYTPHAIKLIEELGCKEVDWLGTSMGGIIGMLVASLDNSPIKRLVLNDIGPVISRETMRLAQVVGNQRPRSFHGMDSVIKYFSPFKSAYGITDDKILYDVCESLVIDDGEGGLIFDYDPEIFAYTRELPHFNDMEIGFWEYWQKVKCPVYILHGEHSTALTDDIIARMRETHNNMEVVTIKDCGHAPHLMTDEHIDIVKDFLV